MTEVRVQDNRLVVRAPFQCKDNLKAIPGSAWDPSLRAWTYPVSPVSLLDIQRATPPYDFILADDAATQVMTDAKRIAVAAPRKSATVLWQLPDAYDDGWLHQRRAYWFAQQLPAACLGMGVGTGKSRVAVNIASSRGHRRILILSILSGLFVWSREFERWAPGQFRVRILNKGTVTRKTKMAADWWELARLRDEATVFVITHESSWRMPFLNWALDQEWDMIIIDEGHKGKAPDGRLSKSMGYYFDHAVANYGTARPVPQRLILTGTIMPHSPLDAYGPYRFLDQGVFGDRFGRFKMRYSTAAELRSRNPIKKWRHAKKISLSDLAFMLNITTKQLMLIEAGVVKAWDTIIDQLTNVLGEDFRQEWLAWRDEFDTGGEQWCNQKELHERLNIIGYFVDTDECMDLPERIESDIEFDLSPKTMKIYRQMEADFYAEVDDGLITAQNGLVKILRLMQITSGFVPVINSRDETEVRCVGDDKKRVLADKLAELDQPVVVFARFTKDLDQIEAVAKDLGLAYGEVSGRRKDLTDKAEMPPWCDLLAAQIRAGGTSVDFTRAHYEFYFSIGHSLGDLQQALGRVRRGGQDHRTWLYRLMARNTIDRTAFTAMMQNKSIIEAILKYRPQDDHSDDD